METHSLKHNVTVGHEMADIPSPINKSNKTTTGRKTPRSESEKLKCVLQTFRELNWGIKDFVQAFLMTDLGPGNAIATRRRRFEEALSDNFSAIDRARIVPGPDWISLQAVHAEFDALVSNGLEAFSQWSAQLNLDSLHLLAVADELEKRSPLTYKLLSALVRSRRDRKESLAEVFRKRIVSLCTIIAFSRGHRTSTVIPYSLGVYLHEKGVQKRVLNVLAGLGICPGYTTILKCVQEVAEHTKGR